MNMQRSYKCSKSLFIIHVEARYDKNIIGVWSGP